jgi:Transposase DDE domain
VRHEDVIAVRLAYTNEENGQKLRRYWTNACRNCSAQAQLNDRSTATHYALLEAVQKRLDENPQAMRERRETAEHPFATLKMRMGATHFLMKRLPKVATEMALHVLAYNLTRVMNIMGIQPCSAIIEFPIRLRTREPNMNKQRGEQVGPSDGRKRGAALPNTAHFGVGFPLDHQGGAAAGRPSKAPAREYDSSGAG